MAGKKSNAAAFNLPEALNRLDGNREFLGELAKLFRDDFGKKVPIIEDALNNRDFEALRNIGHSLKGAAAILCLEAFHRAARKLETAGLKNDIDKAQAAFRSMKEEFEAFLKHPDATDLFDST